MTTPPRYIVFRAGHRPYLAYSLAEALTFAGDFGGTVYERLGLAAALKLAHEDARHPDATDAPNEPGGTLP